jgi:subtilisin family serine protease
VRWISLPPHIIYLRAARFAAEENMAKSTIKRRAPGGTGLPQSNPHKKPFTPETLDRTVIAIPLLVTLNAEEAALKRSKRQRPKLHPIIIDLNLEYPGGRDGAQRKVEKLIDKIIGPKKGESERQGISGNTEQYMFADLEGRVIRELVRLDSYAEDAAETNTTAGAGVGPRSIFHIWPDFEIKPHVNKSISTVKADAARVSFSAFGDDIVWAVLDSGIEGDHPHFKMHDNLKLKPPLEHYDFTRRTGGEPLVDDFGHGTHVAGIIAGEMIDPSFDNGQVAANGNGRQKIYAYARQRNERGSITYVSQSLKCISGMAPRCKLLSFKVLDSTGTGRTSWLIKAIQKIQEINGYGRRLLIHGVNLSLGYQFDPEWFACGQSPLCVEVDRLVRSGVVVVVAAGNSGYGSVQTEFYGMAPAGLDMTIDDPGNAELAITVGATHRDMPHVYGVSYFSGKGPTGDGRAKPDIVAPGEKILSCAAGNERGNMRREIASSLRAHGQKGVKTKEISCDYKEESGTSMATPHVSGVIAAFMSVRREFIGQPERIKEIFLSTATDLKRERYFQGSGLVDLMRAIQSV